VWHTHGAKVLGTPLIGVTKNIIYRSCGDVISVVSELQLSPAVVSAANNAND